MSTPLDVLVIEGGRGSGAAVARALGATAGHRAHRCTSTGGGAPCRGVVDVCDCPLDHGADVALVVAGGADDRRGRARPRARAVPGGPACRWSSWATTRSWPRSRPTWPHVSAQARTSWTPSSRRPRSPSPRLERAVLVMAAPLMRDLGIDLHAVDCTIDRQGDQLRVRLDLPEDADEATRQALAVRALAALGACAATTAR